MSIDLLRLASQGRAYSVARPWTPEEWDAVSLLTNERGLSRVTAADYVRNGIMDLESFDKATKADFKPKTLEDAHKEAEDALKENGASVVKKKGKTK